MSSADPRSVTSHHAASSPAGQHPAGGAAFSCGPTSCGQVRPGGNTPKQRPDRLRAAVAAFNAANPIGTRGLLLRDNGEAVATTVKDEACIFAGHIAVARFEGLRGFFSIERFVKQEGKDE